MAVTETELRGAELTLEQLAALREITVATDSKQEYGGYRGHVQISGGNVYATDNYIMVRRHVGIEGEAILDAKSLADACKQAEKVAKSLGIVTGVTLDLEGPSATLTFPGATLHIGKSDETFPKCEQLIPVSQSEGCTYFGCDPYMVRRAAEALGCNPRRKGAGAIQIDCASDALKPFKITAIGGHPDDVAVVMPVRLT